MVENVFGRDEVVYGVTIQVPPASPMLSVSSSTTKSLSLQWRVTDNGGSPITGYVLSWRSENGVWRETEIDSDRKSFILDNIKCGTNYELFLVASNSVGKGKPSSTVAASTKGSGKSSLFRIQLIEIKCKSLLLIFWFF